MEDQSINARPRLVADIGGTNARFALINPGARHPTATAILACADYPSLHEAAEHYLGALDAPRPREAVFAVATAIEGDKIKLTNHVWSFSVSEMRRQLDLGSLRVINDFTALALALPHLTPAQRRQIGGGAAVANTPLALLGPGTGLGVSGLIPSELGWVPLQGEGGHVTYGGADRREREILAIIGERFEHVSAERLLSGPGLVNLYTALAHHKGVAAEPLTPPQITERGLTGRCALCAEVLDIFCGLLGTVAGNLVLNLGARGGVYIGGGIIPRLGAYFERSPFRRCFQRYGRFSTYLAAVPSYVIIAELPALLGAAYAFDEFYRHLGWTSRHNG